MARDLVRPLKIETPAEGGTETDMFPVEANLTSDYLASKGISLGGSTAHLIDKTGAIVSEVFPLNYQSPSYTVDGDVAFVEFYSSSSFITTNRIARADIGYDINLAPTSETWVIYDTSDGTTILRTYTNHYSVTGDVTLIQADMSVI